MNANLHHCLACGTRCAPDAGGWRRVQIVGQGRVIVPWRLHFFCAEHLKMVDELGGVLDEDKPPMVDEVIE
jgi:hypothetical protein